MLETVADLWELHTGGAAVAVTTSGLVGRDGLARLGRGCARQAGERFPWFAARLGAEICARGNHVAHVGQRIASFPVEHHPLQVPDLRLIARSTLELSALSTAEGWPLVVLPRPGCGAGGLAWSEVRPVIAPHLDDRFVVVTIG
ncbi:MAG: ADP-ribose-binding protein [Anaeromyxobacter sp. RBG_16_69_14]|nr:MAG: ADP-ribose-binding protein [Anaeromyxobacter sp. RBG_16_69_14]